MAAWRMREPIRLDAEDEVGMHPLPQLPCWEQEPAGFYYCLLPAGHGGDHMAEDGEHTILAVWGASDVDGGDTDEVHDAQCDEC